jgi:hypothetical protein
MSHFYYPESIVHHFFAGKTAPMQKIFCFILCTIAINLSVTAQTNKVSLSSFDWLLGTWENQRVKAGESASETWMKNGDYLAGTGVSLRGSDTTFVEKLKIIAKDGHYYYVADVSHNAAPVYFKMTEVSATGFVCENPEHDFPKKISYAFDGETLTATISAGEKKIPFIFRRGRTQP